MATLSTDGILRNFTADDFSALWGEDATPPPAPVLSGITPTTVPAGYPDNFTLTGTGFRGNGIVATLVYLRKPDGTSVDGQLQGIISDTQLLFSATINDPLTPGTWSVTVVVYATGGNPSVPSNALSFTVT